MWPFLGHSVHCLSWCTVYAGCPLGEVDSQLVPRHQVVRIMSGEPAELCYKTCRCGGHGILHRCSDVACSTYSQCYPQHAPGMIRSTFRYSQAITTMMMMMMILIIMMIMAACYVWQSAVQTGSAAASASVRKSAKYSILSSSHVFLCSACWDQGEFCSRGTGAWRSSWWQSHLEVKASWR